MKYLKNFVNPDDCDQIYSYLKENTSKTYNVDNTRPWFENNNLFYSRIDNPHIKDLVRKYIIKLSTAISLHYKQNIYPHYTDLVVWHRGKYMEAHRDDGFNSDDEVKRILEPRHVSSLIYLNDDFTGGETFVGKKKFKPKKGAALIFKSNLLHGVTQVKEGVRGTIASWFTKDFNSFDI
jgi:predicted 2-oxoglutarate/Fe(II)-dependent dioxygenase YbiX|tara:strand:- start:186 stop:722 length:537 start_codon:yes stop_codon:yes gene_type:complete